MVKWFGESWGAPVNDPASQVPAPVGQLCATCAKPVESGDRGVLIPTLDAAEVHTAWHLGCWFREIGIQVTDEVLGEP